MKKKRSKLISTIIMTIIGAGIGFLVGTLGADAAKTLPKSVIVMWVLLFVPAFLFVIGFHEAGHVLAGVLVKFDFKMYVVGPFLWEKEESGWKFKWNKNVNTFGGMVICMPTGNENLKNRFSIYSTGGPLASLLLVGISYLIFIILAPIMIAYLFALIAFLSGVIFLSTAIPFHTGGFTSDGGRIWNLQLGGDKARFELLILKIISSSTGGLRPSKLSLLDLKEALALAKKINAPFGVYLHSYFHQLNWDVGNLEAAEKHLQDYISEIESIPAGVQNAVWLDAAFYYAYAKKDLEKASFYWNLFTPAAMIPKAQIFATEASINVLKNERVDTLKKIDTAIKEIPNMLDRGIGIALQEKLVALRNQVS